MLFDQEYPVLRKTSSSFQRIFNSILCLYLFRLIPIVGNELRLMDETKGLPE